MLEGLFNIIGEYGNPTPRYTGPRCLVERLSVGGCDLCQQACPHEAIEIEGRVNIIEKNCTGCGLCVQACPSGALEFDVTANLGAIREQGTGVDGTGAKISCSKANEGGKVVPCLARLTASAVVAAGAWNAELTLVHGDCAGCDLGGPGVPASVQGVIDTAQQLRAATGRPARVTLRAANGDLLSGGERLSRRGAFGSLLRSARTVVAENIPESPLPFVDWSEPAERVPAEWVWRRRALKPTPAPETPVHWPAPVVDDSCIDCPVCTNVCPTEAIKREVQPDGAITLHLDLGACTGCHACARSCPPQAITLQPYPEGAFAAPVLIREGGGAF